jgi:alcohol dehydrogenase (cytochrome c)
MGSNLYINTSVGARLIAIDVDTGEPVFDASTLQLGAHEVQRHSGPPLAVDGKILVGQSNGSGGNRGWVGGFSAEDGSHLWTFWIVPGPGEFGHETWADDHDAWRTGGGAIWTAPSYDPDLGLVFYGTGDPAPWGDPEYRPGDNLFTVSTIAIDVETGELAWYFQETPNESWDYDTVNPKMLYELDGKTVVGNFSRNGFYYTLDRATGEFLFAEPWTNVNWTAGLDPKTGLPVDYDPSKLLQDYAGIAVRYDRPDVESFCPYYYGAPTHFPPTYDPTRKVAYASGGLDCGGLSLHTPLDPLQDWEGKSVGRGWDRVRGDPAHGFIYGVDVLSGQVVKKLHMKYPLYAGLMGTAGDLIFTGHLDGTFAAYDKDTLQELWSIRTGTPIAAPPISFAVGGEQFIAVLAGGQFVNMGHQDLLDNYRRSANLIVFGL